VSESQTKTGTRPDVVSSSVLLRYIGFNVQCRILLMERITHHPQQCNFSILRESCVGNQLQEFHWKENRIGFWIEAALALLYYTKLHASNFLPIRLNNKSPSRERERSFSKKNWISYSLINYTLTNWIGFKFKFIVIDHIVDFSLIEWKRKVSIGKTSQGFNFKTSTKFLFKVESIHIIFDSALH
jgi:hypothetical protein